MGGARKKIIPSKETQTPKRTNIVCILLCVDVGFYAFTRHIIILITTKIICRERDDGGREDHQGRGNTRAMGTQRGDWNGRIKWGEKRG